ncbi:hypothetical protein Tfu_0599 [Thermobifida fusca YX]|uniref:VWFA domain-containing protein n=2 Tax=Thermobifida fusca TaxID=2021 RepID=Q47SD0_THEFY|nr:hypothetical protein Tfu_0599 [Thermobifida fusca YX]
MCPWGRLLTPRLSVTVSASLEGVAPPMQGLTYGVDIVLCIDATGSMSPIIDRVKESALRFHEDLRKVMAAKSKNIDSLRVRVIAYRDYYCDAPEEAMVTSEFFSLPQQAAEFSRFVNGIEARGGGDEPETGLEALALAMRSDWDTKSRKRRQIIVVWTDASVHPLEKNAGDKPDGYPQDIPEDFDELTDMWEGQEYMDASAKRLILYAPDALGWTEIANHWENVIHFPSQGGNGLEEVDYSTILDTIANSI